MRREDGGGHRGTRTLERRLALIWIRKRRLEEVVYPRRDKIGLVTKFVAPVLGRPSLARSRVPGQMRQIERRLTERKQSFQGTEVFFDRAKMLFEGGAGCN